MRSFQGATNRKSPPTVTGGVGAAPTNEVRRHRDRNLMRRVSDRVPAVAVSLAASRNECQRSFIALERIFMITRKTTSRDSPVHIQRYRCKTLR